MFLCQDLCRKETTLTTVWPLTDAVLGSSSYPSIISVRFGCHFTSADCQGHLINSVNGPVCTAPAQINVRPTVNQGQCLGGDGQRQALGRGHVEEPVGPAPLPQLGPAVWVTGGQAQVVRGPGPEALP